MMRALLVGALLLSSAIHAQSPGKLPRVGLLNNGTTATNGHLVEAFKRGLADQGYVEGKNIVLEIRYAEGQLARLPAMALEMQRLNLDVLVTPSALGSHAARKAGISTPIVFAFTPDPVAEGFAASLARPGGNMTGLTSLSPDLGAKRVQILREAIPGLSRLAVLYSAAFPGVMVQVAEAERAAMSYGIEFLPVEATRIEDVEAAFAEAVKRRADAMLVIENPMFFNQRKPIVAQAGRHRLPAVYISREYVDEGGLMSYGSNYADLIRRAATHVAKILRGARPGDLPVEQPTQFDFVVNLRAARALGLAIPHGLLVRADTVID